MFRAVLGLVARVRARAMLAPSILFVFVVRPSVLPPASVRPSRHPFRNPPSRPPLTNSFSTFLLSFLTCNARLHDSFTLIKHCIGYYHTESKENAGTRFRDSCVRLGVHESGNVLEFSSMSASLKVRTLLLLQAHKRKIFSENPFMCE